MVSTMTRKSKGTVEWRSNAWWVKITAKDGSRKRFKIPANLAESDRAQAETIARDFVEALSSADESIVVRTDVETVINFAKRWCAEREKRGIRSVGDDRIRLSKHIAPVIGHVPLVLVQRDHVENVVAALDRKIADGEISWLTASHIWSTVTSMFREACTSKNRTLRLRQDNPCDGVLPPERGATKSKQYLWPSEFLALVSCTAVPLKWRRIYAIAVYTYMRAGEIEGLEWDDIDLNHGFIFVRRSVDRSYTRGRSTNTPKANKARRVPIDPELRPVLEAMRAESDGQAAVVRFANDDLATSLRRHLAMAGVTRSDLYNPSVLTKAITFHDLRATGLTWCAMRGDEPGRIMQRAGHKTYSTTMIYVREVEALGHDIGTPFPTLPAELYQTVESSHNRPIVPAADAR